MMIIPKTSDTRTDRDGARSSPREKVGERVYIVQRGTRGIWTASFWQSGQHRRRSLKTANRKVARERAMKLEVQLGDGEYAAPRKPLRIADAVRRYLDSKRAENRKPKTLVKYTTELTNFAEYLEAAGVAMLDQLRPEHFEKYRSARSEKRSAKTLHVHGTIIKQFCKWCIERELLQKDPLRSIKLSAPYVPPKIAPTKPQVDAILAKLRQPAKAQVALLAYTGLRAEELAMLRPQDVDLAGGWIHVVGKEGWTPKTQQARKVPIHPVLGHIMTEYVKTVPAERRWFFCAGASREYPAGNHVINAKKLNDAFQQLARALGFLTGRKAGGLVLHSLRHFFETQAVDSRIPQFVIDAWMGHVGHRGTGRQYYWLNDAKSQEFIRQVAF